MQTVLKENKLMKNITIIGINFYPEDTAIGLYTTQMAEYLAEQGFNVSVVTGFPYYPQWKIWNNYKSKPKYMIEKHEGIKVYRYKQYVHRNPTFKNRVMHILSFTFGSFRNLMKIKSSDLVIAVVPFTSDVLLAHILAKRTKAKTWIHVQDFEFDAAFNAGIIENKGIKKYIAKLLFSIEKKLFDRADILSTISYDMLEKAKKKTSAQVFYFPNWIDGGFLNPEKAKRHSYLLSNKFKILYSGNIGKKQDWDFFVRAVERFQNDRQIEFIVVGDGAIKDWLMEQTKEYKNVKYFTPVDYAELPDLLCSADLHILFQKSDVVDTVMPSKLLGMMASAKPSLITGNKSSEVAKIIEESGGGEFFESGDGDIEPVINFITKLNRNKSMADIYGINAREYIVRHFSKEKVLGNFKQKIEELVK